MNLKFPNNKKFIFTIIDDTDDAELEKIKPVYDILYNAGLRTTKTIWVYPVRDLKYSKGDSLQNKNYLDFVKELISRGFEIGLHNVGSGNYERNEIVNGLEEYKQLLGDYPNIHVNHSYNKDNIYCGPKRFSFPFNVIVKNLYSKYSQFEGDIPTSNFFWGDIHKKIIKYSRNYEIDDINTLKVNPFMPYRDKAYEKYCNYWYSSTFAPNQWVFNKIVTKKNIDRLESEGGVCILYTHLGYYFKNGVVDEGFTKMIEYIRSKKTCLFLTVSETLDFIKSNRSKINQNEEIKKIDKFLLEFHSLKTRIKYRFMDRIDDFHFKKSDLYKEKQ